MNNKLLLALALVGGLVMSCDKTLNDFVNPKTEDGYKTYTIKQGEQYSFSLTSKFKDTEMKFKVTFDSSAIYTCIDSANQEDINKLYGFSDCSKDHHQASARFGWRWYDNSLQLLAYCYKDGIMSYKMLNSVAIGAEHDCSIKIDANRYIFTLNGKVDTMYRECDSTTGERYRLFPFFGGTENAPHNITIKIKEESK